MEAPIDDIESDHENKSQRNPRTGPLARYQQFQIQK